MASCRPLGFFTLPVVLILLQMCGIQGSNARPPFSLEHGVPEGNRTELSLSGLEFFGPSAGTEVKNRFPRKSHVEEPAAEPSQAGERLEHSSGDLGERAVAGIVFSFLFLVVFAVGGSYIYVTRRANIRRVDSISSQV